MKSFYDALAESINPELITRMTGDQQVEAAKDMKVKQGLSVLANSRTRERRYKTLKPRTNIQKNSLLLNKAKIKEPDKIDINHPINTVRPKSMLQQEKDYGNK